VIAPKRFEPQRYEGHEENRIALFFVLLAAEVSPRIKIPGYKRPKPTKGVINALSRTD